MTKKSIATISASMLSAMMLTALVTMRLTQPDKGCGYPNYRTFPGAVEGAAFVFSGDRFGDDCRQVPAGVFATILRGDKTKGMPSCASDLKAALPCWLVQDGRTMMFDQC